MVRCSNAIWWVCLYVKLDGEVKSRRSTLTQSGMPHVSGHSSSSSTLRTHGTGEKHARRLAHRVRPVRPVRSLCGVVRAYHVRHTQGGHDGVVALSFKRCLTAPKPQPKKPATVRCSKQVGGQALYLYYRHMRSRSLRHLVHIFMPSFVCYVFYLSVQVPMQKNECLQAANRDLKLRVDGKGTLEERFVFRPFRWHEGLNIDVGQRWRTGT